MHFEGKPPNLMTINFSHYTVASYIVAFRDLMECMHVYAHVHTHHSHSHTHTHIHTHIHTHTHTTHTHTYTHTHHSHTHTHTIIHRNLQFY